MTDDGETDMTDVVAPWAIRAAVTLGLPEHLAGVGLPPAELTDRVTADPRALARLIRYLETIGIVCRNDRDLIQLTKLGQQITAGPMVGWLRADGPAGRIDRSISELHSAVLTGEPAYGSVFGGSFYADVRSDQQLGRTWTSLMACGELDIAKEVAEVLPVPSPAREVTVVDVGGGSGYLVAELATRHDHLLGIVLELPGAADAASTLFTERGFADRCRAIAGDFFVDVPDSATVYVLSFVLHEWPDDLAERILANCARALAPDSHLHIIERVVDSGAGDDRLVANLDMMLLAATGGRQRTTGEIAALGESVGLRATLTTTLPSGRILMQFSRRG